MWVSQWINQYFMSVHSKVILDPPKHIETIWVSILVTWHHVNILPPKTATTNTLKKYHNEMTTNLHLTIYIYIYIYIIHIYCLAYRHFKGSLPPYLSSSLCTYEPSRSLRSYEKLLKIPKRNLKSFGQCSFSFMAPSLWNSLPATLRNVPTLSQFKSQLKTFLFAQAFL